MARAIVFAYHNVGVRCLSVLLAHGVDIALVVTHNDNPQENIWFDSVQRLATINRLPVITPDDPNTTEWITRIRDLQPDYIFSFYYRHMLKSELLEAARIGAYNMHGSLLPKYRGRVPVNWAVINGEHETGSTLHRMVAKPDAGAILAQQAVPILPDDTAFDVFQKVTVAAEMALAHVLPELLAGTARETSMNLSSGSYFGGRKPEDGRIDWRLPARAIHNLIRGVAPPYPGAFTDVHSHTLRILHSRIDTVAKAKLGQRQIYVENDRLLVNCASDGQSNAPLELIDVEHQGQSLTAAAFVKLFGSASVTL
jgi:methionyl-tRNA formyltransferase